MLVYNEDVQKLYHPLLHTYIFTGEWVMTRRRRNSMLITDVRMRKVSTQSQLKAVASITISDEFVVHDIKVIEGEKGLFVAMPSRKSSDGEFRDIAHPLNSQTREYIQKLILDKYQAMLKEEESAAALETA
jgi:stage V sporulation protein G